MRIIFVVSWLCPTGCPIRGDLSWAPSASCLAWEFPVSPWRHWELWLTRRMPRIQSLAYCHPNLTLDKWRDAFTSRRLSSDFCYSLIYDSCFSYPYFFSKSVAFCHIPPLVKYRFCSIPVPPCGTN